MVSTCVDFCNENNMLITSGSDDHGDFGKEAKVIDQSMGCINVRMADLNIEDLLKGIID